MTKIPMETKQNEPIWARIFCKWPVVSSSWPTSDAARPKKVLAPVEMTTPSASPCLQVEPLCAYSQLKSMKIMEHHYSREALVTNLLALRQGLAREGSLVNRHVDSLRQTAVGGHDVTDLE